MKTSWNDELIEQEVRKLASTLGHFPSVSELTDMKRGDLANAVAKRGGFLHWSAKLGIARQHSDSDTGWEGEQAVKALLEEQGFSVQDKPGMKSPYDLLVNGCIRCDVKTAKQATYNLNTGMPWSAWFYRIGKAVQSDVVILYRSDEKDCFVLPWWFVGQTNITISPKSPKYSAFRNRFDLIRDYSKAVQTFQQTISENLHLAEVA